MSIYIMTSRLGTGKSIILFYSVGCHLIILFLAGNTSPLGVFFPDQDREMPGNLEIPEYFPARKSLISDITGFTASDRVHSFTVWGPTTF
jgi:hypothetical protein